MPRIAIAGLCAIASLGLPTASMAQSPFTQQPSRGGSFTIPQPRREPGAPGIQPRPGSTMRPPAPPRIAPPPLPPGVGRPGPTAEPLPELPFPELPPLPLPPPGEDEELGTAALPPRPYVAPPLTAIPTAPIPRLCPMTLHSGHRVTLRICQLLPANGLSPGERLLNSQPAIQPGDCFLAEVVHPRPPYPVLVGGTVMEIKPPGWFGRPGSVSLRMAQLVRTGEGQTGALPWRMTTADRRFTTRLRRILLASLLTLEGAGTGASIGAQFSSGNMAFIGGGMGIGAVVGLCYATFQRGTRAHLEPGDTFEVVVGTTQFRPVPRDWQTILYPATDPLNQKRKHR